MPVKTIAKIKLIDWSMALIDVIEIAKAIILSAYVFKSFILRRLFYPIRYI